MEQNTTLIDNPVVRTLLNRRSIRKFKPDSIDEATVATLETVAQHAASSQYLTDWSAIRVEDPEVKQRLAEIGNQAYIAEAPLLYVFILDEHRNARIAARKGVDVDSDDFTLTSSYRFTQAQNDAVLALHAMETAAYSLGLGCVILGSILNSPTGVIETLKLPRFTYPVLGLAIGKPDQEPALKPRMPRSMQFFTDAYPADPEGNAGSTTADDPVLAPLDEFDARVHQYYDLRNTTRPVDAFSDQIASVSTDRNVHAKAVLPVAAAQGFKLEG